MSKFENVSCSQCGQDFGPGDHGFSHCENHRHLASINNFVRYVPLINGTAFMGMGPNTGLNAGKEYPYMFYADHERVLATSLKERDEYWEGCLSKVDRQIDALTIEVDKWRHDAQVLALRYMGEPKYVDGEPVVTELGEKLP